MEKRLTNPASIDAREIADEITAGRRVVAQFSRPAYTGALLARLNTLAAEFGPALEIRFYGHYGGVFDASVVDALPDVQALAVDCLQTAENLDALSSLKRLKSLSLGVHEGAAPDFLGRLRLENVERLILDTASKKNLSLDALKDALRLRELYVNGQTRGLQRVAELPVLEKLTLRSMPKKQSLEFVNRIARLRHLTLSLGGRENIREIEHPGLERLDILLVRGFNNLDNLPAFPALRFLRVEDQLALEAIRFRPGNESLEILRISNCKKLARLEGLARLVGLRELRLAMTSLDADQLMADPLPPHLVAFAVATGRARRNDAIRRQLDAMGYLESL